MKTICSPQAVLTAGSMAALGVVLGTTLYAGTVATAAPASPGAPPWATVMEATESGSIFVPADVSVRQKTAIAAEILTAELRPLTAPDGGTATVSEIAGDTVPMQVVAGATTGSASDVDARVAEGIEAYRQGDYRAARELLAPHTDRPSAALNYVRAGYQLGEFTEKDLTLLLELTHQKSGAAARMLGDIYRGGKYVPQDREQAEAFYTKAVEFGDARSMLRLAQLHDEAGDTTRAIDYYEKALADFPEKEPRYLYLVAASTDRDPSDRADAAIRLDHLAASDVTGARAAFSLYRKHDVPGADDSRALAAAEAAVSLGAHELAMYVASECRDCSIDEVESLVRSTTNFDDSGRAASALARLATAGRSKEVIAILDSMPPDRAAAIGVPLVKRLNVVSNQTVALAQIRLQAAGFYGDKVDGILGRKTLEALKKSSKASGGNLSLTSPEFLGFVIATSTDACGRAQSGSATAECSP
jgi:tetratricopeptide (TPR) repeat protein